MGPEPTKLGKSIDAHEALFVIGVVSLSGHQVQGTYRL